MMIIGILPPFSIPHPRIYAFSRQNVLPQTALASSSRQSNIDGIDCAVPSIRMWMDAHSPRAMCSSSWGPRPNLQPSLLLLAHWTLPQIHPQTSHLVDYIVHVCLGLVSYLLPTYACHLRLSGELCSPESPGLHTVLTVYTLMCT